MSEQEELKEETTGLKRPQTRLYAILARQSSKAVIFRRGPTRKVQLISWDRATDEFLLGQWFHGRIYERRGDLSPSGDYLIYFAASFDSAKEPNRYYSWTAVSKPPYLTALLLWPKKDCWGGGGHFRNETTILLNHAEEDMALGEKWTLPPQMKVKPIDDWAGGGEDSPVGDLRDYRGGWRLAERLDNILIENYSNTKFSYPLDPEVWAKTQFKSQEAGYKLATQIVGLHEEKGPWYVQEFAVIDAEERSVLSLGRCCWADWDSNGDLLFAKEGKLFRLKSDANFDIDRAIELIDLSDSKPYRVTVPEFAKKW